MIQYSSAKEKGLPTAPLFPPLFRVHSKRWNSSKPSQQKDPSPFALSLWSGRGPRLLLAVGEKDPIVGHAMLTGTCLEKPMPRHAAAPPSWLHKS